jgi:uncharacterized membrane protein YozB (DUF420 family)
MNWGSYAVLGTLFSLLLWILQRKWKWHKRLWASFPVLVGLALILYLQIGPATLGTEKWYQASPYLETWFFLLMLAGMAARYITKAIVISVI